MRTVDPRPFRSTGWVVAWDAGIGVLQIGDQLFYVPPGVAVTGVGVGVKVTAIGHHDVGGRRVVTHLRSSDTGTDSGGSWRNRRLLAWPSSDWPGRGRTAWARTYRWAPNARAFGE